MDPKPTPAGIADVLVAIEYAERIAAEAKPDDRTPMDRRYAVLLTDLERVHAYALMMARRVAHEAE